MDTDGRRRNKGESGMTIDVLLDSDGDLPARTVMSRGMAITAQRISLRLHRHLGEWFEDTTAGIPWMEWKQAKPFPLADASARLRQTVEETPGVIRVEDWTDDYDGLGAASFSGVAICEEGELDFTISPFDDETSHNRTPLVAIGSLGTVIP